MEAMITPEEFKKIRDFVSTKAISLMNHENKCSSQTGFPISNYTYFKVAEKSYYSISTNTFMDIINNNLLTSATNRHPKKFGTNNAYDVIEAIYLVTQFELCGIFENYKDRLLDFTEFLKNAHCYIIEQNSNGELSENVLRIDLFRQLDAHNSDENNFDFTGGLFHAFKHFSINEVNLSVGQEKAELYHPIRIIDFAIKAFFCSDLKMSGNESKYTSYADFDEKYNLKFMFYYESSTKIYFINTIRKDKKNR